MHMDNSTEPRSSASFSSQTPHLSSTHKGMLALVIGLGVIILLATTVLVVIVIKRMTYGSSPGPVIAAASQQASVPPSLSSKDPFALSGKSFNQEERAQPLQATLPVEAGSVIKNVTALAPDRFVITLINAHNETYLIIWDSTRGRVLQTIHLSSQP